MASRLTSFVFGRPAALVWSVAAAALSVLLYWQWQSLEAKQAVFLAFYSRAAPHFPAGELDRLAPSSDFLVIFAVWTGITIAGAVVQWRQVRR